jgi:hypothetical protein
VHRRSPDAFKLVETRRRDGYTYRLYRNALGETRQTYEIGDDMASRVAIMQLLRAGKKRAAGKANLVPNASGIAGRRGISADPDRIDAVLADAGHPEMRVVDICKKHGISTKTYYRIVRGA